MVAGRGLGVGGRDPAEAVAGGGDEGGGAEGGGAEGALAAGVGAEGGAEGGAVEDALAAIWGTDRQPMPAASESATREGRITTIVPLSRAAARP